MKIECKTGDNMKNMENGIRASGLKITGSEIRITG